MLPSCIASTTLVKRIRENPSSHPTCTKSEPSWSSPWTHESPSNMNTCHITISLIYLHLQCYMCNLRWIHMLPLRPCSPLFLVGVYFCSFLLQILIGWSLRCTSLSFFLCGWPFILSLTGSPTTLGKLAILGLMANVVTQKTPYVTKEQWKRAISFVDIFSTPCICLTVKISMAKIIPWETITIKGTITPDHWWTSWWGRYCFMHAWDCFSFR